MEIFILVLLMASLVCVYVTIRKLWYRFYEETDMLADQAETNTEALGELDKKIRSEADDLDEKIEKLKKELDDLKKKVDEIPVEQLQSVYDSEKQFQDGLNAIMSYGQQTFGLRTGEK